MITAIYFKCSDGSRFTVKLNDTEYAPFFGVITAREHDDDPPVSFARFDVEGATEWRGKYAALAKVMKECRIYDRGIDRVTIERSFPYHEQGMQKLLIAEKRIALEMKINRTHWATRARKTWKHKFAEK